MATMLKNLTCLSIASILGDGGLRGGGGLHTSGHRKGRFGFEGRAVRRIDGLGQSPPLVRQNQTQQV